MNGCASFLVLLELFQWNHFIFPSFPLHATLQKILIIHYHLGQDYFKRLASNGTDILSSMLNLEG